MYLVSLHFLCAAHTLHCLGDTSFFPSQPATIFSSLCIMKSLDSLPGILCLGSLRVIFLLWPLKVIRTWLTLILDFWYPGPSYLVHEILVLYFLFVFSILYTKIALESVQFSRYNTAFFLFPILQFSSEMSNNWCSGLPCLCPSWIYCTGQQHKASLFPCLFSWLPFLCSQLQMSWIILIIRTSLLSFHTLHHYVS